MRMCILLMILGSLAGCGPQLPVADYSNFGSPRHSQAILAYDGDNMLVLMEPEENKTCYRQGLSIVDFESKTGSKGNVFIHYPKGFMEMRFIAYGVDKANSEMMFEWKVAQKGKAVQHIQVRIVPANVPKVFVDGREISVEHNKHHNQRMHQPPDGAGDP